MIRPAAHDDIQRMVDLGASMHAESPAFRGMRFDGDKVAEVIEGLILSPLGFVRVAELGGVVIGGMLAVATPHFFSSTDLIACDLALFIDKANRGGIAAARLIAAYQCWAAGVGAVKVQLGVMAGIAPDAVEALCVRLGARRAGLVMEF